MGIMSKNSGRLPERPLPPSLTEQDEDILSSDGCDMVFTLGQEYLAEYEKGLPSTPTADNTTASSLNASNCSTTSSEGIPVPDEQIKESYLDVMNLLSLYSNLTDVPWELEDKYCRLKSTSDELTDSIARLRTLSQDFGLSSTTGDSKNSSSSSVPPKSKSSKEKIRKKK